MWKVSSVKVSAKVQRASPPGWGRFLESKWTGVKKSLLHTGQTNLHVCNHFQFLVVYGNTIDYCQTCLSSFQAKAFSISLRCKTSEKYLPVVQLANYGAVVDPESTIL